MAGGKGTRMGSKQEKLVNVISKFKYLHYIFGKFIFFLINI